MLANETLNSTDKHETSMLSWQRGDCLCFQVVVSEQFRSSLALGLLKFLIFLIYKIV